MQKRKTLTAFLLVLLTAIFSCVAFSGAFSHGRTSPAVQQQSDNVQIPTTDYWVPEPADPIERAKRQEKGNRYHHEKRKIIEQPQVSTITESESFVERLPPLPVALSQAIISGEITNAQAYLSSDRSAIYSEITIRVEEIFKNSDQTPLEIGGVGVAEREGGGVRFPSGHVQYYTISGERMPKVGGRYLLFLQTNDSGQDFRLLKGYDLRGGKVYPMDLFSGDAVYRGIDQNSFRTILLKTLKSTLPETEALKGRE